MFEAFFQILLSEEGHTRYLCRPWWPPWSRKHFRRLDITLLQCKSEHQRYPGHTWTRLELHTDSAPGLQPWQVAHPLCTALRLHAWIPNAITSQTYNTGVSEGF